MAHLPDPTSYIFNLQKKKINHRVAYEMTGVLIAILGQVLLVSKHYEYRYLVPGLALYPLLTILAFGILKNMIRLKSINIIIGVLILAGSVYCIPKQVPSIRILSRGIFTEMKNKMVTKHFVETLPSDAIKLLTPSGYGCPFHDFSIKISHCWAGRENEVFMPVYKKLYPFTYQYFTWENRSKYWNDYDISNITCSSKPVYFYIDDFTPELYSTSLSAILPEYPIEDIKQELVFENLKTNEKNFKLKFPDPTTELSHITSQ
jgi:hypothetical protein